jgi:hypothetical protein
VSERNAGPARLHGEHERRDERRPQERLHDEDSNRRRTIRCRTAKMGAPHSCWWRRAHVESRRRPSPLRRATSCLPHRNARPRYLATAERDGERGGGEHRAPSRACGVWPRVMEQAPERAAQEARSTTSRCPGRCWRASTRAGSPLEAVARRQRSRARLADPNALPPPRGALRACA